MAYPYGWEGDAPPENPEEQTALQTALNSVGYEGGGDMFAGINWNAPTPAESIAGDAKTTVYTVPAGKTAVITHVVIRSPSASLAGGTDFDIGSGANADTWRQTIDLSSMTAVTDYMVIPSISAVPVKYTLEAAGSAFGIKPITGATLDSTATMDVFGYLF